MRKNYTNAEIQDAFDRLEKMLYASILTAEDAFEEGKINGDRVYEIQHALEKVEEARKGYNSCQMLF